MSSPPDGVLVVSTAWAGRGGLQRQLDELARRLGSDRRVIVLTWKPWARPRRSLHAGGVEVLTVPSLLPWDRDLPAGLALVNVIVSILTGVVGARTLARHWRVVCAVGLQPEASVAVLAAGPRRRVVVRTWLVGPLGNVERMRRSLGAPLVRRALRQADAFVVETAEAGRELIGVGLAPTRVHVLALGVDLQRFRPRRAERDDPRRPVVLFTGRFDLRQKRIDLLIEAWRRAELTGWQLWLAGAGPDEPEVRRRASGLTSVRVLPWQDTAGLLADAEVFVLPTDAETTALAALEGMACGVPGLISDLPGIAERGLDGVRLVPNQVEAWTTALREMAALDPARRRAEGQRARAWAERHADGPRLLGEWVEFLEGR
jgi:glycosyltransferase involved in cell wall biosynthesis